MTNNELIQQEKQAEEYANKLIKSHSVKPEGEEASFGVQGFWQEMVLSYLKEKALNYVGQALKHLAINHLTDLASWLLEQLESYLLSLYEKGTEEEKELFKKKIKEKFPNSHLAKHL